MSLAGEMEASRQTTVLFADVTGSTKLYATAGDALAAETIGRCLEKLRLSAEATGGRVVKTMGDSVMALFSSPGAAASAAASMQVAIESLPPLGDIKLGLRIGFHAGPVIQRNNDIYGDTVNVAYRLHEQAKRGQVLTSDDTASLLPQLLRNSTRLLYPVTVKGKAEDVALCELVWRQSPDITDLATTMSVLRIPLARLRLKYLGRDIARRRGSDSLLIGRDRSEEHTSELQSPCNLVCRLLLEKKKIKHNLRLIPRDKLRAELGSSLYVGGMRDASRALLNPAWSVARLEPRWDPAED